jgi:dihydrofolate synthase/folylpolyglutamate synthase
MPEINTFADVEAALSRLRPNTMVPVLHGPENTPELMEFLGNPQDKYKVIHVAGTSGKTSTAYYAAALLKAAGKRVGLNVSPHADTINERVQVDMQPLPEAEFCADFGRFLDIIRLSGIPLNYFQAITAFALWEFAEKGVEYAVVEVGIGGLADSTNVFAREDKICIISDIGYGHVGVLGHTLTEIAANKAGIIQLKNAVFARKQSEEILAPIIDRSRRKQADLHTISDVAGYEFLPVFQRRNFALAQSAVTFALVHGNDAVLTRAQLEQTARIEIPARMETHRLGGKTVILDGAHNPQKLRALLESVRDAYKDQPVAILFALTDAKQTFFEKLAAELALLHAYVIVTGFPPDASGRYGSADPAQVALALQAKSIAHEVIADAQGAFTALQNRNEPVLLVTGSFYLLNHVRPLVVAHPAAR